jgi:phospholipase C
MNRQWQSVLRAMRGQQRKNPVRRFHLQLETLENRLVPSTAPFQHVLILSVDGLHQADVADPALSQSLTNILSLETTGVTYTKASTTSPSDSFPGTLAILTGATSGTTGVFYDDSYSRTLFAPGTTNPATATPGTETLFDESIDKNPALLSGGGDFTPNSIDPSTLPVDANGNPVYPHQFVNVNTIYNVAHDAGLHTAFSDKHPGAYDIANGHNGNGVDDFYSPEVAANAALYDPVAHMTVNADALLAMNPFTDVSKYQLVDASTDPMGMSDPNLELITNNALLTERYDDLKVQAILNEINGLNSLGTAHAAVPALFYMNFQAVSVAQKYAGGGIVSGPSGEMPSNILMAAMQHTDHSVGQIVAALQGARLWNDTELILTAKHGQNPRVGVGGIMADSTLPGVLTNAGVGLGQVTQDDVSLIWLSDQSQTSQAVTALQNFKKNGSIDVYYQGVKTTLPASQIIDKILSGSDLTDAGLGDPATNSRTPDIIVTLKPGFIWVGHPTRFKFKRAEHGGFSPDDTQVPLIVSSGGLLAGVQGNVFKGAVDTTQIAVTSLVSLGLDPSQLQGAVADGTEQLPGLKLEQLANQKDKANQVLQNIDHFIVIYQENWSFDSLYGEFPGANGVNSPSAALTIPQVDKFGNPLPTLPSPSTNPPVPDGLPAQPFDLSQYIAPDQKTGDIIHRFYHQQLQIDNGVLDPSNGSMDKFVTWSDNGSLVFSYFDATNLPEGQLAQQFTLDDNFFHAAYGGSFLNHQFLIAAAAPQWNQPIPAGFKSSWDPVTKTLKDNNLTIDGKYDVNTTFGLEAPHPAGTPANKLLNPINDNHPFLPDGQPDPTYTPTIGDRLDAAGVSWTWYSGGWSDALAGNPAPLFQFHHQPFAYYANYAPLNPDGTQNPQTSSLLNPNAHLQDETQFFTDVSNGNLPAVSFIKPLGPNNEHPGYTDLVTGQQHVADIVHAVQNSPEWANTAIVITYDENGGRWDHVSPPNRDQWGDGTRVPAIVISPFAKQGFVDHQQHDTLSILSTIEARFGLQPLNQADADASTLSVDFQKRPNSSIGSGDNSAIVGGHQNGNSLASVAGQPSGRGIAEDIISAANAGGPAKVVSSSGTEAKNSIGSAVWTAGAQWLSVGQDFATQAAKILQGTAQKTGGLGINWDLTDFSGPLHDVFGPEVVKAI